MGILNNCHKMSTFFEPLLTEIFDDDVCFDASTFAGTGSFAQLIGKFGYCGDDVDVCHDVYLLMCFAAAQVAVGSVQMLSFLVGKLTRKNKVSSVEAEVDGTEIETASNGSITIFGVLSWIAGIIIITVYCKLDDESNGNSEVLFNSFRAAIIMDMTLFALGLLVIVMLTCATVWKILFRKNRIRTLCGFIFGLVIMALATGFYAAIAFVGWKYVTGDCYNDLSSYSPSTAEVKITFDSSSLFPTQAEDIAAIISSGKMIPTSYECLVANDCNKEKLDCVDNKCVLSSTGNECVNDYDCGDVTKRACGEETKTCQDITQVTTCFSRNQCQMGFNCFSGSCKQHKEVSLLAFPQTFYNVECEQADLTNEFSCSMQYTVPATVNSTKEAASLLIDDENVEFLLSELNARFAPANVDFVSTNNTSYRKTEFYGVVINSNNIITINGEKVEDEPDNGDGRGEGSGESSEDFFLDL